MPSKQDKRAQRNAKRNQPEREDAEEDLRAYLKKSSTSSTSGTSGTSGTSATMNEEVLAQKWKDMIVIKPTGEPLSFEDTFVITAEQPTQVDDVHDDIKRELAFYTQTVKLVDQAHEMFEASNIPWKRPLDYFAEMLKSDEHMVKIKSKLLIQKKRIEKLETLKHQQKVKKHGKQIQADKEQQKIKQQKAQLEAIKKWRKARESGSVGTDLDAFDIGLENDEAKPKPQQNAKKSATDKTGKAKQSRRRTMKDKKYGSGGKRSNKNTYESSNQLEKKRVPMKKRQGKRARQAGKRKT